MDIKPFAKYQASLAQNRAIQRGATIRTAAAAVGIVAVGAATYVGYDATTGRHTVATSAGVAEVRQNLTTAGLQKGQAVEFDKGALDSTPRIKTEPTVLPVPGGGEELVWGALLRLRRYLGDVTVEGTPLPYYRTEYWLVTESGTRELLRVNDFEEMFDAGGPSTPRSVFAHLSAGADGTFYADFRIAYGADPFDTNQQVWVDGIARPATPWMRVHLQIRDGVLSDAPTTESFREYMGLPLTTGSELNPSNPSVPDRLTKPCQWETQFNPLYNFTVADQQLYASNLQSAATSPPYTGISQPNIPISAIGTGATIPIWRYTVANDSVLAACTIDFANPAEILQATIPAMPLTGPPFLLPSAPPSGFVDTTNLVRSFVAVVVE